MPETNQPGGVTIGSALENAVRQLDTVSDTPALDANLLLAFVLDKPRSYLFAHPEADISRSAAAQFHALIERRRAGEPVAYLLGEQGFWSLELAVSDAVLVPRPETELLVETALKRLPRSQSDRVADLGTGSGAIALALATERPDCRVIATDVSREALSVARANARRLQLSQIEFREGDWLAPVAGQTFDLIAANPPYVAAEDPHLADLAFEPRAALVADDCGRGCLRHLVEHGLAHLIPGGWLLLEHGMDQDAFVRGLMERTGYVAVATEPDLAGHPRVTLGRKPVA